ncbi:MAG: energy transducer TonB [Stenotrophomonas sp.]
MSHVTKLRLLAPALLLATLAACSGKDETAPAAAEGAAAPAATSPATVAADKAAAEKVQGMDTTQLRDAASAALRENRMYAPAGDNALEYYVALRDKLPNDATIKSALTDLQPYALIAAEQALGREDFTEAQRLITLLEKVDPTAPALPRLKQGVTGGMQVAERRTVEEADKAKKDAENKVKQQAEQQRLAQQQAAEASAAQALAAKQEATRKESERLEADRQAAARREAEQRSAAAAAAQQAAAPKPAAAAPSLRAVSTPAPRYPADALRSGTSGEVLVELTVGTDGSVTDARVLRANPARVFDREALNAVRRWKFEPIGSPVTTRRTLAFAPNK